MNFLGRIGALLLILTVFGPLAGCSGPPKGGTEVAPMRKDPGLVGDASSDEYIIGAGDQLSIFVYRNPDLSEGGVAVRPDGRISTPLIEDIMAAGKKPKELARELEQKLSKFIQDPECHGDRAQFRRSARPPGPRDRGSDRTDRHSLS